MTSLAIGLPPASTFPIHNLRGSEEPPVSSGIEKPKTNHTLGYMIHRSLVILPDITTSRLANRWRGAKPLPNTYIFYSTCGTKLIKQNKLPPFPLQYFYSIFFFSNRAPIKGWLPTLIPIWEKVKPMVLERTGVSTGLACRTLKRCCTKFCPPKFHLQTTPRVLGWVKPMVKNHTQDFGLFYGLVITVRYPPLVLGVPVQSLSSAMTYLHFPYYPNLSAFSPTACQW